jgi:hypothetical protein
MRQLVLTLFVLKDVVVFLVHDDAPEATIGPVTNTRRVSGNPTVKRSGYDTRTQHPVGCITQDPATERATSTSSSSNITPRRVRPNHNLYTRVFGTEYENASTLPGEFKTRSTW